MLAIDERWLEVPVEKKDFRLVVEALRSDDWVPAIAESRESFYRLASSPPDYEIYVDARTPSASERETANTNVEVFFTPDAIYIVRFVHPDANWARRFGRQEDERGIRVMRVANSGGASNKAQIDEFCDMVRAAIASSLDGRRVRHWSSAWEEPRTTISPLARLRSRLASEEVPLALKEAVLDEDSVARSEVLSEKRSRELLIEIAQARFAREEDVLSRRGKAKEDTADSLEALKSSGLIVTEYVLQCTRHGAPLIRVTDRSELTDGPTSALKCANCGKSFADETLSEGYSISDPGRALSQGSHWMTVWTTQRLVDLGVPLDAVAWNLEESSEEVDLLFEHLGRLWIVELKDRDFGAGDAHPFNYRRVRYRADEAIVMSAGKVSSDAKKVFTELQRGAGSLRSRTSPMILIEGLDQVVPVLQRSFESAALARVRSRLEFPSAVIGFDLAQVAVDRS
jgi:hypothetical protein